MTKITPAQWEHDSVPMPEFAPGAVWLAGAGPGDVRLLSWLALYGLSRADCVFYDSLVDTACLQLAAKGTALCPVGKRGGRPSISQAEINAMLIAAAKAGKKVLRLKGGDPFIFGRGAEEALALHEAGIPFRIIPGISAGPAAAAYAGIPLTMRQMTQSFAFITACDASGHLPANLNWPALAQGADALVFYMAARQLPQLAAKLLAAGRRADEPIAFIMNASLPSQRVITATLGRAAEVAKAKGLASPAIIILGEVVNLREKLDWFIAGAKLAEAAEAKKSPGAAKAKEPGGGDAVEREQA